MLKRLLLVVLMLAAAVDAAQAYIRITLSRFEDGLYRLEGQTTPNTTVTVDGKFNFKSDGGGYFKFERKGYKPAGCMSDIKTEADVYSAVIAGCFSDIRIEDEPTLKAPATPPG